MKNFIISILLLGLVSSSLLLYSQAVKVKNGKFIHVGQEDATTNNHSIVFGKGTGTPNNGNFGIEYYMDGLDIFRPWPTRGHQNFCLYLKDNYKIGLFTNEPQSHLHVNSDIAYNGVLWKYSDINLKQNILPLKSDLTDLLNLSTITYNRKHVIQTEAELLNGRKKEDLSEAQYQTLLGTIEWQKSEAATDKHIHYGLVAQELEKIYPDLVDKDSRGYLRVDYIGMIPVLVNAIKELNTKIEVLENQNKELIRSSDKGFPEGQYLTNNSILYQNTPNPFNERTTIKYYIPSIAVSATLCIYDLTGSQKLKLDITERETGSISIDANQLQAGMYLYSLFVDGKEVDTKKMILTGE